MSNGHALYAPSATYRNLSCLGSLALIKKLGAKGKPSVYAEEGTLAHDWINKALTAAHGLKKFDYEKIPDEEMRTHVQNYVSFIGDLNKQFRKVHKGVEHYIEQVVKYDNDFWGTVDYALTGFHKLTNEPVCLICDFKYGRGVEVEAEENEQLISYAICLQNSLDVVCSATHFFVYQPRTPGKEFTRWSVKKEQLVPACSQIIQNKKKVLSILKNFEDTGVINPQNLKAGDHCRFCPAKTNCPCYIEDLNSTQLKILDNVPEIPVPDVAILTLEQKVAIFTRRKMFTDLIKSIGSDLLELASKEGVPGLKIVEGMRRRKWKDEEGIGNKLASIGVNDPYKRVLIGIGEVEKQIGKGKIDDLTELSKPSYQLVPESDKRQEVKQIGLEDLGEIEFTE